MNLKFNYIYEQGFNRTWRTGPRDIRVFAVLTEYDRQREDDRKLDALAAEVRAIHRILQSFETSA